MPQDNAESWNKARRARDKLVDRFIDHPDVSLIDIGYVAETEQIVLRIHVRKGWIQAKPEKRVAFPDQEDDIPVIVMLGEYQLEADSPAADEN